MNDETQLVVSEPHTTVALTAAQSRVDAIGNVLSKAYEKAGTLNLTPEQSTALMAPFPDEAFQRGAGGNERLIYIEHAHLRDRLNEVLGLGQWAIIRMRPHWAEEFEFYSKTKSSTDKGTRIFAECALIVQGCFVAESIGSMDYYPNQQTNYADAAKGAVTSAFRRCASDFGVGLQAWKKDWCAGWHERNRQGRPVPSNNFDGPHESKHPVATPQQAPVAVPKTYSLKPSEPMKSTEKTRDWMLSNLKQFPAVDLLRFCKVEGYPVDKPEDWPLDRVPTTKLMLAALVRNIEDWQAVNSEKSDERTEPWWNVMVSVPRAGTKRIDYLTAPDTIRSLYDAMKAGDEKSKHRLWGLANEWAPASYTDAGGKLWPPRPEDHDCRAALDQFLAWEKDKK